MNLLHNGGGNRSVENISKRKMEEITISYAMRVARHSQRIIGQKSYNGQASLRMAQHTSDDKHISLLQYLSTTGYKKIKVFKFNTWK